MSAPRCLGSRGDFEQRRGTGSEQQIVEQSLVLQSIERRVRAAA